MLALGLTLLLGATPAASTTASSALQHAWVQLPASILPDSLRASRASFEDRWNALFVSALRGGWRLRNAGHDALLEAFDRIATAETTALGSTIARDALQRAHGWDDATIEQRIAANDAEARALTEAEGVRRAEALGRTLALYHALGESRREAVLLGRQGAQLLIARELAAADSVYHLALPARERSGDALLIGNTLNDLGSVAMRQNRWPDAREWLTRALDWRRSHHFEDQIGRTLGYMARTLGGLGERDSAIVLFQDALARRLTAGDSAEILTNFSSVLVDVGRYDEAIAASDRALPIVAGKSGEILLRLNRGSAYVGSDRSDEARRELDLGLASARAFNDPEDEAKLDVVVGQAWLAVPDPHQALDPLSRAKALADSIGDGSLRWSACNNLAMARLGIDDSDGAAALAKAGWAVAESIRDTLGLHDLSVTRGTLAEHAGHTSEAADWYLRAVDFGETADVRHRTEDKINAGWLLFARRDRVGARRQLRAALDLAREARSPDQMATSLSGLGTLDEMDGHLESALAHHREAATIVDTLRSRLHNDDLRVRALSSRYAVFESMIHALFLQQSTRHDREAAEEAFQWAERSRARFLNDLLVASGREYASSDPPRIAQVQARLAPGEAVVYYSVGDSATWCWTILKRRWEFRRMVGRARLEPVIRLASRALADPASSDAPATARRTHQLYDWLLAPVAPDLEGVRSVRVAADGPLNLIPFEALRVDDPAKLTTPRYVLQRWMVSYLPSARWWIDHTPAKSEGRALAVADPDLGSRVPPGTHPPRARLAGTRDEARALRDLGGKTRVLILEGAGATWADVESSGLLERARVLHFAMHGDLDAARPENTGLWFAADSSGMPRRVTPRDLLRHRIAAHLVSLPACESGLGRLERGEGVLGLPRAFLAAGTSSVLQSLWKVNDRWSVEFFRDFYTRLLRDGLPADEALTLSKRRMLEQTAARSPFYWAVFVLQGDTGGVRLDTP